MLHVQVDVGSVHDSLEVEHHALPLHTLRWRIVQTVIAIAHFFESATRQAALDVGCHVGVVGPLVSGRSHPGLLYLEVVRHVDLLPCSLIV